MKKFFILIFILVDIAYANIYKNGLSAYDKENYSEAKKFFEASCTNTNTQGCSKLGDMFCWAQGVKKNRKQATELYERACSNKDAYGCLRLGETEWFTVKKKEDYKKIIKSYEKSCEYGNMKGCKNLAYMFIDLEGEPVIKKDIKKGIALYSKACNKGEGSSCIALAILYFQGIKVRQNNDVAVEWFGKGCDNGNAGGCKWYKELRDTGTLHGF